MIYLCEWWTLGTPANWSAKYTIDDLRAEISKYITTIWLRNCQKTGMIFMWRKCADEHNFTLEKNLEEFDVLSLKGGRLVGRTAVSALHHLAQLPVVPTISDFSSSASFILLIAVLITSSSHRRETIAQIPMQPPSHPHTTPKKCPTIVPVDWVANRWGDSNPSPAQLDRSVIAGCHPLALACQCTPSTEASFRAEFVRGAADKRVKKPRAAFPCNLSTLIVCSLLQTTLAAATCN